MTTPDRTPAAASLVGTEPSPLAAAREALRALEETPLKKPQRDLMHALGQALAQIGAAPAVPLPGTCPRCQQPCGAQSLLCTGCWGELPRPLKKRWAEALAHLIQRSRAAAAIRQWACPPLAQAASEAEVPALAEVDGPGRPSR